MWALLKRKKPSFLRVFLASQFDLWKSYLDQQIPADKRSFLEQFYNQVIQPPR